MTRLLVDANIPHAEAAFSPYGVLSRKPGREITRDDLRETDILLVRSVTTVDASLIEDTPVRFVGTATAGTDHVDTEALRARGIGFASAPGSNAASVVDWTVSALLALAVERGRALSRLTLGVIGVGEVGRRLVPRAEALGMRVVTHDPPRAAHDDAFDHTELTDLLAQSDAVTLHTPLTTAAQSPWPTVGLIGRDEIAAMRPGAWLLNAARGRVLDGRAVLSARRSGRLDALALDVWPGEPEPADALVEAADLATPHIAGYAADAKTRGTAMLADALAAWALGQGLPAHPWLPPDTPPIEIDAPALPTDTPEQQARWLDALARQATDVRADDARFRAALAGTAGAERAAAFSDLRKTYPERREMSRHAVRGPVPPALASAVAEGLGMAVGPPR